MCLIIANVDGRSIPEDFIHNAWRKNNDGFGVMWSDNRGKLRISRGIMQVQEVVEILTTLAASKTPYVAHFRMATHGMIHKENCHPFRVTDYFGGIGMVHNGCFWGADYNSDHIKSDTHMFVNSLACSISNKVIHPSDLFGEDVEKFTTIFDEFNYGANKVAFMSGDGEINIINEEEGSWIDGVWYSNTYSIGGDPVIRKFGLNVVENAKILHNLEALELVLSGDIYDDASEEFFLNDEDVQEIEGEDDEEQSEYTASLDLLSKQFDLMGLEDVPDKDDDEVVEGPNGSTYTLSELDGYYTDQNIDPTCYDFEGETYDLTASATFYGIDDIKDIIVSAHNGSEISLAILIDLIEKCKEAKIEAAAKENTTSEDVDDPDWNDFINEYYKKKRSVAGLLPATTGAKVEEPKSFATSTNSSRGYSAGSYVYGDYNRGRNEAYGTTYYPRNNDPIDQIVEALLQP